MKLNDILKERGSRYGEFKDFSEISQKLKDTIFNSLYLKTEQEYFEINNVILEGVEMICHKLARIANGDAYYLDSWRDLSAYSKLVCDELEKTDGATDVKTKQVIRRNGRWVNELDLEQILNKVDKIINKAQTKETLYKNKEPSRWEDKCLDCKYCHHIVEPEDDIDFYVCEHSNNQEKYNIIHNGKVIDKYKDIKKIWKDCKYKESIFKGEK